MSLLSKEKWRIVYQVLRINLRTSIITLIGLSIALSTVTTCFIYLETNKADYYLSLYEQENFNSAVTYHHDSIDLQTFENPADILSLQEGLDQKISEYGLENVLQRKHSWYPMCSSFTTWFHHLNQSEWGPTLYGLNINESILADCVEGSYFPTNMNETILLISSSSGLTIGNYYNISKIIGYSGGGTPEYYNHTLRITGLITPESLRNNSLLHETLNTRVSSFSHYKIRILTNLEQFLNFINSINAEINSSTYKISVSMKFRVYIQISNLNSNNVVKLTSILVSFFSETANFYLNGNHMYGWNSNASWIHNIHTFYIRAFFIILCCIPAFLAAILLVKFSFGVIHERRKKSLLLFRMRGVSPKFLFNALLLEMLIISLIAALISIILGILGYLLFSTTTGYLTFDWKQFSFTVIIPHLLLPSIIILSVGFTFLTSFRPMIRLTKSKLSLLDQETTGTIKPKPRKIVSNINTLLLIQGLSGIFILIFLLQLINGSKLEIEAPELFNLLLPVITVLLVVSPLSFLVGFVLTYNRFIPLIIKNVGNYCWKRDWGLVATVFRNLSVNYKITGQVTLLIACTLSFLMILSSLPVSLYQYNIEAAYYHEGADLRISISKDDPVTFQELRTQLTSIQGVKFTTIENKGFSESIQGENGLDYYQSTLFLGIEENFHQVGHWQKYYDDQPLQELVQALFNSTESFPVILDSKTAQKENLNLKDHYRPFITNLTIVFSVEGVSEYWPAFIDYRDVNTRFLIVPRDLLGNISLDTSEGSGVGYYTSTSDTVLCKVSPGYDPEVVINQILAVTKSFDDSLYVDIVRDWIKTNPENIFTQFLWLIVNFNFLDSLFVVLVVITLFTFLRMSSHTTEIGLSRALGMKRSQIFLLMFLEPLALFLLSGIPGGVVGSILLIFFASIMSPLLISAPPFILDFNLFVILSVFILIFCVTAVSGIATSFMATRADISKILKVE